MKPENYIQMILEGNKDNPLKAILDSAKAYRILDNSEAEGSTWTQGGCAILAFALRELYDYPVYVIFNVDKNIAEHFMVKDNQGNFLDYDGTHKSNKDYLEFYKHLELIKGNLIIKKWDSSINSEGIIINQKVSDELANLIKRSKLKIG